MAKRSASLAADVLTAGAQVIARLLPRLHYMHYNFARPHQTLTVKRDGAANVKRTPAMAAGVEDRIWSHTDIAGLLD